MPQEHGQGTQEYPPAAKHWGAPPYRWPENAFSPALSKSIVLQGGALRLYGFTATSTNVAAQFIQVFDARDVPANGTVPLFSLNAAIASPVGAYFGSVGRSFDFGIVICTSTTQGSLTLGAADTLFDVQYVY